MKAPSLRLLIGIGAMVAIPLSAQTFAENITRFHPGCHAKANLRGGDCIAAAHRYCEARIGKNMFGFLYLRDGMNVYVGCAPRSWYGDVPYSELAQSHPQCRSAGDAQEPQCVAAAHRYCEKNHALQGGWIQEIGPKSAAIACFKPSRYVVEVDYMKLARLNSRCTAASASGSIGCAAASAQWCKATANQELGVMQEVGPKSLAVACVRTTTSVIRLLDGPGKTD